MNGWQLWIFCSDDSLRRILLHNNRMFLHNDIVADGIYNGEAIKRCSNRCYNIALGELHIPSLKYLINEECICTFCWFWSESLLVWLCCAISMSTVCNCTKTHLAMSSFPLRIWGSNLYGKKSKRYHGKDKKYFCIKYMRHEGAFRREYLSRIYLHSNETWLNKAQISYKN